MISYPVLLFWCFITLKITLLLSSLCPSRDVFDPNMVQPDPPIFPNVTPTELWPFPFVVSLIEQHTVTKLYRHLCGGVIVNLNVVMTTCGCVAEVVEGKTTARRRCKRIQVLAGTPDMYLNHSLHKQLRHPYKCELHPRCDLTKNLTVDVALVYLRVNLTLTTHTEPMKVFSTDLQDFTNRIDELRQLKTVCFQPRWSSVTIYYGHKPKVPGWIYQTKNQLINDGRCVDIHCTFEDEGPACRTKLGGLFCATTFQGDPPMVSDTGGPLLCHGMIFGILSVPSCDPCSPAVYVGPTIWLDYIKDLIAHNPDPYNGATRPLTEPVLCSALLFAVQLLGLL